MEPMFLLVVLAAIAFFAMFSMVFALRFVSKIAVEQPGSASSSVPAGKPKQAGLLRQ